MRKEAAPIALDLRIHSSFDSAAPLWDALERSSGLYPFQRRAWLEIWFETIGRANGWELAIIETSTERGAAIFPLGARRAGGLRRLMWLGAVVSDYAGPLFSNPEVLDSATVIHTLRTAAARTSCDIIDLDRIPARLADGSENPLARAPGIIPQHYSAHAMNLAPPAGPTLNLLSAKERYNLRRSEKLLASGHDLRFSVATDAAERASLVEEMIRQKRARYAQMAVADNFADASVVEFYRRATSDPRIAAHLSALYLDNEPISLHWGVAEKPRMYYLMPAFKLDERAKLSPGKIFLLRFIDAIRAEGYETLDFANGDEPYKDKWCDIHTPLYCMRVGVSPKGKLVAACENSIDAIKTGPLKPALLNVREQLRAIHRTA